MKPAAMSIASCLYLASRLCAPAHASEPAHDQAPTVASVDWYQSVWADIDRQEYEFRRATNELAAWSAPNRAHDLRSRVSRDGLQLFPRSADADGARAAWSLVMRTSGFGRAGNLESLCARSISADGDRVELDHGSLIERFENRPDGVEQSWIVGVRPQGDGPLWIEVDLEGSFCVGVDDDGRSGTLTNTRAGVSLRYRGLEVFDATGRSLIAQLENRVDGLAIRVDDGDAVYPLLVDPVLAAADWSAESNQASANFGVVAHAGDVNGDGYDDVVVGAPNFDGGQTNEGRAFLYLGSATGLSTTPSWTAENDSAGSGFGSSIGTAGDVNCDGFDDVIVGAWKFSVGGQLRGRAYVYHGSAGGLAASPAWLESPSTSPWYFGWSVGTAGDVNGDGCSDVIVGAPNYQGGGNGSIGRAYVYHGSATGLSTPAHWTVQGSIFHENLGISVATAGDVDGNGVSDVIIGSWVFADRAQVFLGQAGVGLAGTPVWIAYGGRSFGSHVSSAGDVNGDGYDDVIVGENEYDGAHANEGRAYVYYGSPNGPSPTPNWIAEGNQANAHFGAPVASAGDFNADGFDDVVVGATAYDAAVIDGGRSSVYFGSSCGLRPTAGFVVDGDQAGAGFGAGTTAGDVDGDGHSDLIVGAGGYDGGQTDEGAAFLYLGSPGGGCAVPSGGAPFSTRVYSFVGPASNTSWAWEIAPTGFCSISNYYVSPVATGTAHDVTKAFADSINGAGCSPTVVIATWSPTSDSTGSPKGLLTVKVGANGSSLTPFTLGVGPAGGPINCFPTILGGCTVNPLMQEVPLAGTDCNANGTDDVIDIAEGTSVDANWNWVPDECEYGTLTCFGDGSGAACPCNNSSAVGAMEGCLNSTGHGARLRSTGVSSIANDTLTLLGSQLPNGSSLFFQSATHAGGGIVFGDGLRCAIGPIQRLGVKTNSGGICQYPDTGDPQVSVRGNVAVAGVTLIYQVWYRDAASVCTGAKFNFTNTVERIWIP